MRPVKISAAASVLLALTFVPAYAGQGNSGSHGPKTTTTHGPSTTTHGPAAKAPSTATHGSSAKAPSAQAVKGPTATPTTTTKAAKADAKLAKVDAKSVKSTTSKKTDSTTTTATTSSTSASGTSSTSTSSTTTSTPTIDFTSGPVGEKLAKNSMLRTKLESRLKALGYDGTAYQAAYGFKNLGQFVAATNVSRNLGVSFEQLKVQMTGLSVDADGAVLQASLGTDGKVTMVDPDDATKPAPTKNLGQAIQTVKSTVDATSAAQTATAQADAEIQSTSTTVSK